MSDCNRPEYGSEYRKDNAPDTDDSVPDAFGIDHSKVVPF